MNKPYLIIPILEQDNSAIELLSSVKFDNWAKVFCLFDSCNWDYVEIIRQAFPLMGGAHNNGRPAGFSRLVNIGLKQAFDNNCDAFILNQFSTLPDDFGLIYTVDGIMDFDSDPSEHGNPFYATLINKCVVEKIGYLDEVFINSGSSEDYQIRASIASLPVCKNSSDCLPRVDKKQLKLTDFALWQLNYKWGFKGLTLEKLYGKVLSKSFTEDMYVKYD